MVEDFNLNDFITEVRHGGLQCIVLAPSRGGKSHLVGTYPGKILYLCGSGELHGIKSAFKESGDSLVPVCWDRNKDGSGRSPDAAYEFILKLLRNPEYLKEQGFQMVALDSMVALFKTIRGTQRWANKCQTDRGKHNSFAEPDAYMDMIDAILIELRNLCDLHEIDYIVTSDLEIQQQGDDGSIIMSKPRMPSFSVAERTIQQFPDVIMLSRMKVGKKSGPVIQMGAGCTRESKNEAGVIVKTIDFTPSLADVTDIPEKIKADLKEILKLKGR